MKVMSCRNCAAYYRDACCVKARHKILDRQAPLFVKTDFCSAGPGESGTLPSKRAAIRAVPQPASPQSFFISARFCRSCYSNSAVGAVLLVMLDPAHGGFNMWAGFPCGVRAKPEALFSALVPFAALCLLLLVVSAGHYPD